jgi:rhamnosyltransferase subunit B
VLPQARLIVHHGGIGTAVDALRTRTPQWLFPGAHDQPDNAERLRRLGVARVFGTDVRTAVLRAAWIEGWPSETAERLDVLQRRLAADTDGALQVADWVADEPVIPEATGPGTRSRAA